MFEFYDAAAPHNSIIVGANDPDAGLGDFLAGGNQSPISGQYGIGADNVLELKVVTPAGDTETENQCSAPDLFFAFRGGGGSTSGVMLSATLPMPSMPWSYFTIAQSTANTGTFWPATASFHLQLPSLVKRGMMAFSTSPPFPAPTPAPSLDEVGSRGCVLVCAVCGG